VLRYQQLVVVAPLLRVRSEDGDGRGDHGDHCTGGVAREIVCISISHGEANPFFDYLLIWFRVECVASAIWKFTMLR
jgi:hypothetical protein